MIIILSLSVGFDSHQTFVVLSSKTADSDPHVSLFTLSAVLSDRTADPGSLFTNSIDLNVRCVVAMEIGLFLPFFAVFFFKIGFD